MSLLWESTSGGTHYSVRKAGHSVRLYSNSVFHSQWNPKRPFAGAVWDCLSLPCLYRPAEQCRRVLLLGLGGGAGVRQLQTLVPFDYLQAIEIDSVHIKIARRWFGVTQSNVEIVHADAIEWLKQYKGEGFDLIIDDLFGHSDKEPLRAQPLNMQWVQKLDSALNPGGTMVVNCIGRAQLLSGAKHFAALGYVQAYRWSLPEYHNAIGVFFREPVSSNDWITHLNLTTLRPAMKHAARWIIRRPLALDGSILGL